MSDEIDIEEHDPLDNPTIRRIFPDLSVIKKEISEYEEGLDTHLEPTTSEANIQSCAEEAPRHQNRELKLCVVKTLKAHTNTPKTVQDEQLDVHLRFKTFLDSLSDDTFDNNDDDFDIQNVTLDDANNVLPFSSKKDVHSITNPNKRRKSGEIFHDILPKYKKNAVNMINPDKKDIKSDFTSDINVSSCSKNLSSNVQNLNKEGMKSRLRFSTRKVVDFDENSDCSSNVSKKETKLVNSIHDFELSSLQTMNLSSKNLVNKAEKSSDIVDNVTPCTEKLTYNDSKDIDITVKKEVKFSNNVLPHCHKKKNLTMIYPDKKVINSPRNNIFILGSKPNPNREINNTDKKQLKLVLKNIGPFLKESKQFCRECSIMFPNVNEIEYHMNKVHSAPADNSLDTTHCKAVPKFTQLNLNPRQCQICKSTFSNIGNVKKHLKNVHKYCEKDMYKTKGPSKMIRKKDNRKRSNKELHTKTLKSNKCFHCHKQFESQASLIEHLYDVLNPKQNTSDISTKDNTNTAGPPVDKDADKNNSIECRQCSIKFLTQSALDEHRRGDHKIRKPTSNKKGKEMAKKDLKNIPKAITPQIGIETNKIKTGTKSSVNRQKRNESKADHIHTADHQSDDNSSHSDASNGNEQDIVSNSIDVVSTVNKKAYQCFICSQYITQWKLYTNHMDEHNIKDVSDTDSVMFDGNCKLCSIQSTDIRVYNRHISRSHQDILCKKINLDDMAFHSVVFKCIKCEIFFLSANAARNHSEHEAIFRNWKCLDCHRLFKIKDKATHLNQHLLSESITTYTLSNLAVNRILYKCLKCAVHFGEKEYFIHYPICDLETPNSAYCKTCDILVNSHNMTFHEIHHKDKNLKLSDFTLIESEIIYKLKESAKKPEKKELNPNVVVNIKLNCSLLFCSTCNCFINYVGQKRKRHADGECKVQSSRICRKCGLTFTPAGYPLHKMLHDKLKLLNLQAFCFYDIKSKKQILPPIPKYPKCIVCQVHFLSKQELEEHMCTARNTTCKICKLKLTQTAYKLHSHFHNYKLSLCNKKSIDLLIKHRNSDDAISSTTNSDAGNCNKIKYKLQYSRKKETSSPRIEEAITSTTNINSSINQSSPQSVTSNIHQDTAVSNPLFLFTCVYCQITFHMYDEVIQHCHYHYDCKEHLSDSKKQHSNDNEKFAKIVKFNPFYFRFGSVIWTKHVFDKLTQEQIKNILNDSKYKYECRLKMEEIQRGSLSLDSRVTFYKCDICRSYIDPNELYAHVGTMCTITKKYPCTVCGSNFSSSTYKDWHEKSSEGTCTNTSSHRIILFNKPVHQLFTQMVSDSRKNFILYQCRNCDVVVDKLQRDQHRCNYAMMAKCSYCGLLFYNQEFNLHKRQHELIKKFQTEQITVIMFSKSFGRYTNKLKPSFTGKVYDFTFYKCTNCELCLKSKNEMYEHVCVLKSHESQCPKCSLCFSTADLTEHLQLHESHLELNQDDFNSNVISFSKNTVESTDCSSNQNPDDIEKDSETTQKIYRCRCGLHFLEELNANKHRLLCNPKMKISKQNCFKCDLLFTPGELFNHLLKHHSNKKMKYNYDIIDVSRSKEENE